MNYITVKQFYNENKIKLDLKIIAGKSFYIKKKLSFLTLTGLVLL